VPLASCHSAAPSALKKSQTQTAPSQSARKTENWSYPNRSRQQSPRRPLGRLGNGAQPNDLILVKGECAYRSLARSHSVRFREGNDRRTVGAKIDDARSYDLERSCSFFFFFFFRDLVSAVSLAIYAVGESRSQRASLIRSALRKHQSVGRYDAT